MSPLASRCLLLVAAALVGMTSPAALGQDREDGDKAAIRALVEKLTSAYKQENGPEIVGEVVSDSAFVYARPVGGEAPARVFDKTAYVEAFKKYLWKKTPQKHEHRIDSLTVIGGLGYEIGTIIDVSEDGIESQSEMFNVFARQENGWKLIFTSVPDFFKGRGGSTSADEEAVRELARKFVAVFNTVNRTPFEEFEAMIAGDAIAVQSDGTMLNGRAEVIRFYKEHAANVHDTLRSSAITWGGMTVKVLGGGAVVFGKLTIRGQTKDGKRLPQREEWETLVFRKTATGWQVTEEHGTSAVIARAIRPQETPEIEAPEEQKQPE